MRHKQLLFRGCRGERDLYGQLWLPDGPPLFLVQLVQGLNEHSSCYEEFAAWLSQRGAGLACHDHLPQGRSAQQNGLAQGCPPPDYDWKQLCGDTTAFSRQLSLYCPGPPLFILGHSLGAAAARCLLAGVGRDLVNSKQSNAQQSNAQQSNAQQSNAQQSNAQQCNAQQSNRQQDVRNAGDGIEAKAAAPAPLPDYQGALLCSPVYLQAWQAAAARLLCWEEGLRLGWEGSGALLQRLALAPAERAYRAKGEDGEPLAWFSHDRQQRQAYLDDPWCNYAPSLIYCRLIIDGLLAAGSRSGLSRIPSQLPILISAGSGDPLGRMAKGPRRLYQLLRRAGLDLTELHVYHGLRHELLRESRRQEVWLQLWKWMADKL